MADTKKIITAAAAAGVAAAGIAVAATRGKRKKDAEPRVYHVQTAREGWEVRATDADRASSVHPTKDHAVSAARELARNRAPSRLVIHGTDGSVQRTHEYDDMG